MEKIERYSHDKEREPRYSSKIELYFFRHAEAEDNYSKGDAPRSLTEKGRSDAKSKARPENIKQSVAFGSPRVRTQETAALFMAGAQDEITGRESLEELKGKINKEQRIGSRVAVDKNLDFVLDITEPYSQKILQAIKEGELLRFLIDESDVVAKQFGVKSGTFSQLSASVAKIIAKYIGIAPRWDNIIHEHQRDYSPELKRFLGTHQGVQESFLAKIIELMDGKEARDRFVRLLDNQGFDYNEGFDCEIIVDEGGKLLVRIKFNKMDKEENKLFVFDKPIPIELIENIAQQQ